MKKLYLVVSVIMLLSLLLASCATPTEAPTPVEVVPTTAPVEGQPTAEVVQPTDVPVEYPDTFTVWYKKEFTQETLDIVTKWAEDFGKEMGVKVDLTFVTMADAPSVYVAAIESGTTPDVAMVPFWGPPRYHNMGALTEVTDLAKEIGDANGGWLPSSETAVTFEGKMYGMPWANVTEPLFLRTDVMKALGYTDRPQTFEELKEFAKKANEYGAGDLFGWGITYNRSDDGHLMVQQILWNHGSETTGEDGKIITFNSPETIAGCEYMKDIYQYAAPGTIGWTDSGNNQAWLAGTIAVTGNGPSIWYALNQPDADPTLKANTHLYDWPTGPTGLSTTLAEAFSWVVFSEDPGTVALAEEWFRYIYEPERYDLIAKSSWAQEGPAHNRGMATDFMQQGDFADLRKAIERSSVQGFPGPYTVAAADVASEYVLPDMMVSVIVDDVSCEDAVAKAHTKLQMIYSRYNKY
ncbi:MAG: ABC transporter substrate-binding protein [Anaerolineaceae bacterium]